MADRMPAPRYEVLNVHSHRQLKVLGHQGYDFARGLRSADLVVSEFEPAASLYPLVFVREADGLYRPVALLKRSVGGYGSVGADGRWAPPNVPMYVPMYVPMALRYHPFALAERDGSADLSVCIDTTSDLLSREQGAPLFDRDGQASAALAQVMAALSALNQLRLQTDKLCRALAHFGLFTPIPGLAVDDRGHQVYKVDEADLCRLADAELCVLRQHGWLRALYAHQVSLANVDLSAAQLAHRSPEAFA